MTQADWFGIEESAGAAIGWGFADGTPVMEATGTCAAEVAALLGADDPLIVTEAPAADQKTPVKILPDALPLTGIAQGNPPDRLPPVARLRLAGFQMARPNWDGVVCIVQGDATHWVQISAEEVISLHSTLTPQLAKALNAGRKLDSAACEEAISRPEKLASLLHRASLTASPAIAMGALIGADLAATRPYWLGQQVGLIASDAMADAYSAALALQHAPLTRTDPKEAAQIGLAMLRHRTA